MKYFSFYIRYEIIAHAVSPAWCQYRNFCCATETLMVRIALQQHSAESIVESIIIRVMMNMPHNLWLDFEHCARHAKYSCLGGCCAVSQDRIKHCGRHCVDCAYTTMREYHVNSFSQICLPRVLRSIFEEKY